MKKCPYCAEEIQDDAIKCKHCREKIKNKTKIKEIFVKYKNNKKIILFIFVLFFIFSFVLVYNYKSYIYSFLNIDRVNYTSNHSKKDIPLESVVKIIVNEGTDNEWSGSGTLFTDDGYILTNAHVVNNEFGNPQDNIKVCYIDDVIKQTKCDYEARVINSNYSEDLAVIKVDEHINEIKPYYFRIEEDIEKNAENILAIGSKIKIVGFPGVGDVTITATEGIVSGYKNQEWVFYDGSFKNIPSFLKTDSDINSGNSGGAVFDEKNRFIGVPTYKISYDNNEMGYVIFWSEINNYLNYLVYRGDLILESNQYKEVYTDKNEKKLWNGIKSFVKKDYDLAKEDLKDYLKEKPKDSRALNYLCNVYLELDDYSGLKNCAENLRSLKNESIGLSWYFTAHYNFFSNNYNIEEAYKNIENALSFNPDSSNLLNFKTFLALEKGDLDEAEKINKKVRKIDESDDFNWYLRGLIELEKENYEESLYAFEYSYSLEKDVDTAQYLADYYYNYGESIDDNLLALIYNAESLSLGSKNPNNLFYISKILLSLSDTDSISVFVADVRNALEGININKEILESIKNISDEELSIFIQNEEGVTEVSQEKIKNYRTYINMITSWMYTFINEDFYGNYDYLVDADNLTKVLESIGFSQNEINGSIIMSSMMYCVYDSNSLQEEYIDSCYNKKLSDICGQNRRFDTEYGECLTSNQVCVNQYGFYSYAGSDNYCYCIDGYDWNYDGTSCISICAVNSYYYDGSCYCNSGYQIYNDSCVSNQDYCEFNYGSNSFWSDYKDDCVCLGDWEYYDWWGGWYCTFYN